MDKAEIPISPSVPGDESSTEGNRGGDAASPSLLLTVEDLSTTQRDPQYVSSIFQNHEISAQRVHNPIAVQLQKRSYVARGKETRSHNTNPANSNRQSD